MLSNEQLIVHKWADTDVIVAWGNLGNGFNIMEGVWLLFYEVDGLGAMTVMTPVYRTLVS